jgi:hypothetical protein
MARTHRYEIVLMRERIEVDGQRANTAPFMRPWVRGDLAAACRAMRRNLQSGGRVVLAWLRRRESYEPSARAATVAMALSVWPVRDIRRRPAREVAPEGLWVSPQRLRPRRARRG